MGVHDGHRDRLRARFLEYGLDNFNDLNALELLLFYAIPRRDTNEIAHALLECFGSLEGVFYASERELLQVPGIGTNAAAPHPPRSPAHEKKRPIAPGPQGSHYELLGCGAVLCPPLYV